MQPGTTLGYRIDFENDKVATAPAQMVEISDKLSADFDWTTLQLTAVGWGDLVLTIPAGRNFYRTTVDMTYKGVTFLVEVEIGIKMATGELYAQFLSLDGETGLPPNPLIGFLPPEDGTGRGMGYFTYTIKTKPNLANGTKIKNIATITFDRGEVIATNQIDPHDPSKGTDPEREAFITLDTAGPTSAVTTLPATSTSLAFPVKWSGQDNANGSGVATYTVFVSENGGAFTPWLTDTKLTESTFTGVNGKTYGFYSVATDGVGFREAAPSAADTTTKVQVANQNQAPAISSANTAAFIVGQQASFQVVATGSPTPVFSVLSGTLPAGVTLTNGGLLSGIPASGTGGTHSFTIQAANGVGSPATQTFTLSVTQAPAFTSANRSTLSVGSASNFQFTVNGTPAPTFSLLSGTLPSWLTLSTSGALTGIAPAGSEGVFAFTVQATNSAGTASQNFTLTVNTVAAKPGVYAVAAMGGAGFSTLAIYENGTNRLVREVVAFPGFKGEFYVDSGDISGDGVEDIIVGSGNGSANGHVVVFDGARLLVENPQVPVEYGYKQGGSVRASLYAFVGYSSGVAVRLADLNDDGYDDIVMAPGTGAGTQTHSHVRVWNGKESMADFEAGKPLPYDYRWEMASFWAFGETGNTGGGLSLSVIRQAGPDMFIASQLFKGGSKVFRYDGQKVLTTVQDLTGRASLWASGNTVVGIDLPEARYFANSGTARSSPDSVNVRSADNSKGYVIDRIFGGAPGGLRLGLANIDDDTQDELLVTRDYDSTTKVFDIFEDHAVLISTLHPGGSAGWV